MRCSPRKTDSSVRFGFLRQDSSSGQPIRPLHFPFPRLIFVSSSSLSDGWMDGQLWRESGLLERWQRGKISTFDYLLQLNQIAGRSLHDITQYPVFPWFVFDDHHFPPNYMNDERMAWRMLSVVIHSLLLGMSSSSSPGSCVTTRAGRSISTTPLCTET